MSFYHVLSSNAAAQTFPDNHASNFSTPLHKPHIFEGKWEVGLMSMTHSNCVATFDEDSLVIQDSAPELSQFSEDMEETRISLPLPKESDSNEEKCKHFILQIEQSDFLRHVVKVIMNNNQLEWKVIPKDVFVMVSTDLQRLFRMKSPVLTHYDLFTKLDDAVLGNVIIKEAYLTVGKLSEFHQQSVIKPHNQYMDVQQLIQAFNASVKYARLSTNELDVFLNDNEFIFLSPNLRLALGISQAALYGKRKISVQLDVALSFKMIWKVSLKKFDSKPCNIWTKVIRLPRQQFVTHNAALHYLNTLDKKIVFSWHAHQYLKLNIKKSSMSLEFSSDLMDILGFHKKKYIGKSFVKAERKFSLTRCIQYLYVYSNVGGLIHVGDTKAPLLAVFPFNIKDCKTLQERNFKTPMYVPVINNYFSQINIEVCDDTGKHVPFSQGDTTSLRLHFRRV